MYVAVRKDEEMIDLAEPRLYAHGKILMKIYINTHLSGNGECQISV